MRRVFCISLLVILCGSLAAQTKNARNRNASRTVFEGQPASVRVAPRVTTTIRLPEPVNSVVLAIPTSFRPNTRPVNHCQYSRERPDQAQHRQTW